MNKAESACLAIADISGYTSYLAGVELDHAQDILADLLTNVVEPLRPTFRLAKLEGDAVFLYSLIESIDGSVLLDLTEASYFAFQRRLRTIGQASVCSCNACIRMPELDLKLVVHHGEVIIHEVLGSQELVGPDVVVTHRLLKNDIVATRQVHAYAFLSDACMATTALDPQALGMLRHAETFDDVGEVSGWIHDLGRAWEQEQERARVYVAPDEAMWTFEQFVAGVPVALAWEWLTSPGKKILWEVGFDDIFEETGPGGRRGPGGRTHCVHGEDTIVNEIVDWRPPRYVTSSGAFPNGAPYVVTDEIEQVDGGVIARKSLRAPTDQDRDALAGVLEMFTPILDEWIPTYARLVTEAHRQLADVVEPDLPQPDEELRRRTAIAND